MSINKHSCQSGISLTGFIVFLLVFVAFSFGIGWFANTYYANRLSLSEGDAADFPSVIDIDARPNGLTWDGQNLLFSNRLSPWGLVKISPLQNGQYRKTSIPVLDDYHQQQISLDGISWDGTSLIAVTSGEWFQSPSKKVFIELDPQTYAFKRVITEAPDFAHCLAWDGQNYWAGTRYHTADQQGQAILYKLDTGLNIIKQFEGAGKGCQGLSWDGKYLWWGDVFDNAVTLYDIAHTASKPPKIVHQYQLSIKQQAGITFDGKDIWFGDSRNQQLKRLQQDLYFDWLGGSFSVKNPGHLNALDRLDQYQTGKMDLDDLIAPLTQGKIKSSDIPGYVNTLRSRYSVEEIRQIIISTLEKVSNESVRSTLKAELEDLNDSGEIDYVDNDVVAADSIKVAYFKATVEDGNLLASWKIDTGDEIYSGIDAARPQQIPDDYDFYTYMQYTITITRLDSGTEDELEYEYYESIEVQEEEVLLENITPGEYRIEINMAAQYYTETTASHYSGNLIIKVLY